MTTVCQKKIDLRVKKSSTASTCHLIKFIRWILEQSYTSSNLRETFINSQKKLLLFLFKGLQDKKHTEEEITTSH